MEPEDEAGSTPLRVVVLLSGAGSTMAALLDPPTSGHATFQIVAVGSDREDAGGLGIASAAGIPTFAVAPAEHPTRPAWNTALAEAIDAYRPDLVLSAGFMRILDESFVRRYSPWLLNTHPALLPAFPGAHAVRDALAYGVQVTGATIHIVDAGVDTGPIVAQQAVPVHPNDDEASLHERIKAVERVLLVSVMTSLAKNRTLRIDGRKVHLT